MSAAEKLSPKEDRGLLRFLTCGSVDDGKSTLIGRLLVDTRSVLADTLSAIERTSRRRGLSTVDLPPHRRPSGRARAGDHHRRGPPLLLHRDSQVHHRRCPRPRAVHPQHGDRRLHRPPRHHPRGRPQGRAHPDEAPQHHRTRAGHPAPHPRREQDGPRGLFGGHLRKHRAGLPSLRVSARHPRRALPADLRPHGRHGGGAWKATSLVPRPHAPRDPRSPRRPHIQRRRRSFASRSSGSAGPTPSSTTTTGALPAGWSPGNSRWATGWRCSPPCKRAGCAPSVSAISLFRGRGASSR